MVVVDVILEVVAAVEGMVRGILTANKRIIQLTVVGISMIVLLLIRLLFQFLMIRWFQSLSMSIIVS